MKHFTLIESFSQGKKTWRLLGLDGAPLVPFDLFAQALLRKSPINTRESYCRYVALFLDYLAEAGELLAETTDQVAFRKTQLVEVIDSFPDWMIAGLNGMTDMAKTLAARYPSPMVKGSTADLAMAAVKNHLPAVSAKKKQMFELQQALDDKLESEKHSVQDQEALEVERQRINEELTGWVVVEEILEAARARIASGADTRRWVVQKPEIIEQDLRRVAAPTEATQYVLARLAECVAYPTLDSPQVRSQFDMLRRQMAARLGRFKEAFDLKVPANPAQECAGLLRSLAGAYQLEYDDIVRLLSTDEHLAALPVAATKLMEIEHV